VTSAAVAKAPRVRAEEKIFFITTLLMAKDEMNASGLAWQGLRLIKSVGGFYLARAMQPL
jgi:hypothetical protein